MMRLAPQLRVFLLAGLLCLLLLLPTLGRQSLWYDEVLTARTIASTWSGLLSNRLASGHFPTYFALLKSLGLAGADEFRLRLPSALFLSAACGLVAATAFRLAGALAAIVAALLFALHPLLLYNGQEARPYAMMLFFLAVAARAHVALLLRDGPAMRSAAFATIGTLGAALAIPAGVLVVAVQQAALFAVGRRGFNAEERRAVLVHVGASWAAIALALLALLPGTVGQARAAEGLMKWQAAMPLSARLAEAFDHLVGFAVVPDIDRFLAAGHQLWIAAGFIILAVIGASASRSLPAGRYLTASALGIPLAFVLLANVTAIAARYMIGMLPFAILLAAWGAAWLIRDQRWRWPAGAALTALAVPLTLQGLDALASDTRYDWRRVAAFLHDSGVRDVEILTNSDQVPAVLGHYLPPGDGIRFRFTRPPLEPVEALFEMAAEQDDAWLVLLHVGALPPELAYGRLVCRWRFGAASVFAAVRDPSVLPPPLETCGAAS